MRSAAQIATAPRVLLHFMHLLENARASARDEIADMPTHEPVRGMSPLQRTAAFEPPFGVVAPRRAQSMCVDLIQTRRTQLKAALTPAYCTQNHFAPYLSNALQPFQSVD